MAASSVPSPCILVCAVDGQTGFCFGCLRTLPEIARWGGMDDEDRRAVLCGLEARRAAVPEARRAMFGAPPTDSSDANPSSLKGAPGPA
jgi:predicted Fe-S protein YdhL (DUF1289 family)